VRQSISQPLIHDLARLREHRATFELRFIASPSPTPGLPTLIDVVFLRPGADCAPRIMARSYTWVSRLKPTPGHMAAASAPGCTATMVDAMDFERLLERLTNDLGYPSAGAPLLARKLQQASPLIQEAWRAWSETGSLPALSVGGNVVERLAREHGMKPVAALLTLDWLLREPGRARASLEKGHDRLH
jgi:hypothetical protein